MASRRLPDPTRPARTGGAVGRARKAGSPAGPEGTAKGAAPAPSAFTPEARRQLIAESAYLRAERRGFEPGHDVEDWLAAEAEVDALLSARRGGPRQ